jgi:hypothetical protein
MKNKKSTSSSGILNSIFEEIIQLLHWKLNFKQLISLRNIIISKSQYGWKKNSFLGKALIYHYNKSNLNKTDNIAYHHLLLAEMIRNFSIATKDEYTSKCEDYRIYPFIEKQEKSKSKDVLNIPFEQYIKNFKKSLAESVTDNEDLKSELQNSIKQNYPICSFEDLMPRSRLN